MTTAGDDIILSTAYYPPVSYFASIIHARRVTIEQHGTYRKQSSRNRCSIFGPSGLQSLTVPVERGSFHRVAVDEITIDYSRPWQENHLRSMKTAYNSSPFYEYMADELLQPILNNHSRLLDLNNEILDVILDFLETGAEITRSSEYISEPGGLSDLRESIDPKKAADNPRPEMPFYFQVFSIEKGFIPDLSILDLIFNMGPESYSYLLACGK